MKVIAFFSIFPIKISSGGFCGTSTYMVLFCTEYMETVWLEKVLTNYQKKYSNLINFCIHSFDTQFTLNELHFYKFLQLNISNWQKLQHAHPSSPTNFGEIFVILVFAKSMVWFLDKFSLFQKHQDSLYSRQQQTYHWSVCSFIGNSFIWTKLNFQACDWSIIQRNLLSSHL